MHGPKIEEKGPIGHWAVKLIKIIASRADKLNTNRAKAEGADRSQSIKRIFEDFNNLKR